MTDAAVSGVPTACLTGLLTAGYWWAGQVPLATPSPRRDGAPSPWPMTIEVAGDLALDGWGDAAPFLGGADGLDDLFLGGEGGLDRPFLAT